MKLLNTHDIWNVYDMHQALDDCAAAYQAVSAGQTINPLRTQLKVDDDRTFLMMPCYSDQIEAAAVKTIGIFPKNTDKGISTAPASIVLLDGESAQLRAILDGETITRIRTGASSGVAFRQLARSDSQVGVVIGTGGQAATQALAMLAGCPHLRTLRFVNPDLQKAQKYVDTFIDTPQFQHSEFSGNVEAWDNSDEAARDADVIIAITSSSTPVLSAKNLKPGVTISGVGSYQPGMQEIGTDIMQRADRIYCDDVDSTLAESGDLIIPLEAGDITRDDILGSIGDVISGQLEGRQNDDEIIVYKTVGVAAQDLWTAAAVVEHAEKAGIGTDWQ